MHEAFGEVNGASAQLVIHSMYEALAFNRSTPLYPGAGN